MDDTLLHTSSDYLLKLVVENLWAKFTFSPIYRLFNIFTSKQQLGQFSKVKKNS